MPTIRDLVGALGRRTGVDAAILLGRDGVVIDGRGAPPGEADVLAALVPPLLAAADTLGASARRGEVVTTVVEFGTGFGIISAVSDDACLLLLARADAPLAPLLSDLRRHRAGIAALIGS